MFHVKQLVTAPAVSTTGVAGTAVVLRDGGRCDGSADLSGAQEWQLSGNSG